MSDVQDPDVTLMFADARIKQLEGEIKELYGELAKSEKESDRLRGMLLEAWFLGSRGQVPSMAVIMNWRKGLNGE